jgi:integrase
MPLEIYLRGNVWWAKGRLADSGEYVRKSLGTSDEALAQATVRSLESTARKRRILGPDAPGPEDELTFNAALALYTPSRRDAGYLMRIVKKIGTQRVKDITPASVRALARQLYPDASTDTWQRQVLTPVRAVINNAHEMGKCPPIRIKAFDKKERVKQDTARGAQSRVPKTPGSWPWVLAFCAVADPRDAALAYFMFRHGYRVGQCVAMTRSKDMDLSAGRVRVHASKGHPAHWVQLDPEEVVMIANLPPPYRSAGEDRVFRIPNYRNGALYRRWEAACDKAGIPRLRPHAAGRHGYGTEMIVRQGVDPVTASENLWSDPSVMLRTYSHAEDAEAKVREAFRAGLEAARTNPVQRKTDRVSKQLGGKAK